MLLLGVSNGGLDPDAQTYITAAGITNSAQIAAINTYVLGLKSANLWNKIIARYITYNNSTTCSKNLKNPTTFGGTVVGSPTIDSTGYNGSASSYFKNGLIPSTSLSQYDVHYGFYRTGGSSTSSNYQGIDDGAAGIKRIVIRCTNASAFANFYGQSTTNYTAADKRNTFMLATCVDSTSTGKKLYSNGILLGSSSIVDAGSLSSLELAFDGKNDGAFQTFGGNVVYMLFTVGYGYTATDALNDYNLTQTLKTSLGL